MDKGLLTKATAPTEEPTPGWMYHQIAKITRTNYQTCQQVEDWLLKRLKTENSHVKLKSLVIIRSLAQAGDRQFAQNIVRKVEEIKLYGNYRGPQDPLHGDALNQKIRQAASDAVAAIFERNERAKTEEVNRTTMMQGLDVNSVNVPSETNMQNQWQGFSHSNYESSTGSTPSFVGMGPSSFSSPSSYTPPSGGGKYQGVGNPNYSSGTPPPASSPSGEEKSWIGSTVGYVSSFFKSNKPYTPDEGLLGTNNNNNGHYTAPQLSSPYTVPITLPQPTANTFMPSGGASEWENNSSSGTHEAKLVDEYTSHAGIKVAPSKMEVAQFVQKCASVNAEHVAKALDEKLNNPMWQVRLKVLHYVEGLIKAKNSAIIAYFNKNYASIQRQTSSMQESVSSKAQKILKTLSKDQTPTEQPQPVKSQNPTPVSAPAKQPREAPNPVPQDSTLLPFDSDNSNGVVNVSKSETPAKPLLRSNSITTGVYDPPVANGLNELEFLLTQAGPTTPSVAPTRITMASTIPVQPMYSQVQYVPVYVPQPQIAMQPMRYSAMPAARTITPTSAPSSSFGFLNGSSAEQTQKVDHFAFVQNEMLKK